MENRSTGARYLRLSGRLHADNRLVLQPHYPIPEREIFRPDSAAVLRAELEDDDGRLLLRVPVAGSFFCFLTYRPSDTLAIRADIPLPAKTRRVRLFRDDIEIHTIELPGDGIEVSLKWKPRAQERGKRRLAWRAKRADGKHVKFALRYTHDDGSTWQRLSDWTSDTSRTVDLDTLPGGKACRFGVLAADGRGAGSDTSDSFAVAIKRCIARIQAPDDGAKFAAGAPVRLLGQGFYLEERSPELETLAWHSDRDGHLGAGRILDARELSPGRHKITLTAGRGRRAGNAMITVSVER